jgi:hypothetical protein
MWGVGIDSRVVSQQAQVFSLATSYVSHMTTISSLFRSRNLRICFKMRKFAHSYAFRRILTHSYAFLRIFAHFYAVSARVKASLCAFLRISTQSSANLNIGNDPWPPGEVMSREEECGGQNLVVAETCDRLHRIVWV